MQIQTGQTADSFLSNGNLQKKLATKKNKWFKSAQPWLTPALRPGNDQPA
jgi:hypothetical protein